MYFIKDSSLTRCSVFERIKYVLVSGRYIQWLMVLGKGGPHIN